MTDDLEIRASTFLPEQKGVIARRKFRKGELVFIVTGPIVTERTIYTFPLSLDKHIDPRTETGKPTLGHFLNHSCDPNAFAKTTRDQGNEQIEITARKDIQPGEEVKVDYALMEYELATDIPCLCNTAQCRKRILGYKDLSEKEREKYCAECVVSDYLLRLQ